MPYGSGDCAVLYCCCVSSVYEDIRLCFSYSMANRFSAFGIVRCCAFVLLLLVSFIPASAQNTDADTIYYRDRMVVVNHISPAVICRYPYGVQFLQRDQLDSMLNYVDTELVPVIFKRDKTDLILPNPQLDSIVGVLNRILNDDDVRLSYVWIGGSASPEGPEAHNTWLGKTRAGRLYDYLKAHTSLPDSLIRVENLMEDWRTPLRLIQKHDFPHKDEVLRIWMSQPDNRLRKREIMAIDNGVTWKYLIDKPFRPARNARMVIVCAAEDSTVTYYPNPVLSLSPLTQVPVSQDFDMRIPMPGYRGQFIALKTNLAALGLLVANLGVEFSFGRGFSLDIPFYYSPYDITSRFRVRVLGTQPELRYWLHRDWPGAGHFIGINGTVAGFDISFPHTSRFQDPEHALWGAGISYGYALNFGKEKHWGLEFNIGLGYMNYHLDTFDNVYNGKLLSTEKKNYWGITRVGISLTYKWWRRKCTGYIMKGVGDTL